MINSFNSVSYFAWVFFFVTTPPPFKNQINSTVLHVNVSKTFWKKRINCSIYQLNTPPPFLSRRHLILILSWVTKRCMSTTSDMMVYDDSLTPGGFNTFSALCSYEIQIWKYTYLNQENIRYLFHFIINKQTNLIPTCRKYRPFCMKFIFWMH